ncbi:MAG: hypothetical protein JWN76_2170 [Chitinophagaceae bacterium]|nr:hypothetical protein [Chitinophagaceae bacterium]
MKKLFLLVFAFTTLSISAFSQKGGKKTPAKTEKKAEKKIEKSEVKGAHPLKKDGTPDLRYKANHHTKKDGTRDMRYKENKKH